jgi:hypothetical protein
MQRNATQRLCSLAALIGLASASQLGADAAFADPDEPAPVDDPVVDDPPDDGHIDPPAETRPRDPFAPYELGPGAIPEARFTPEQQRDVAALAVASERLRSASIHAGISTATAEAAAAAQAVAHAEVVGLPDLGVLGVVP